MKLAELIRECDYSSNSFERRRFEMSETEPVHDLLKKLKARRLALVETSVRSSDMITDESIMKLAHLQSAIDAVSSEIQEHEAHLGYGGETELK
jgi:hypothetical protein